MQSGGGNQQGVGGGAPGNGRNPAAIGPSCSSASPSSSSSAVSTPRLGFDSIPQQQQPRQFLRKPEGNESILAFQAGGLQGALGESNFASPSVAAQMSHPSRKFIELAQQSSGAFSRDEGQSRGQGIEHPMHNPLHQAYLQYAFQATQQKSAMGPQSQQGIKTGMLGPPPPAKDQDPNIGNLKMQEFIQATNHPQSTSSKKPLERLAQSEKQADQVQHIVIEQRNDMKPPMQPMPQLLHGNVSRPLQTHLAQPSIQKMANSQATMAAQIQALAFQHNIDLSNPVNVNMMTQFVQSRMLAQQKQNESNVSSQTLPASVPKQQVTPPSAAIETSLPGNSSTNVSGQSSLAKSRQAAPAVHFGMTQNVASVDCYTGIPAQQFPANSRENQAPPGQKLMTGNGMTPALMNTQLPTSLNHGVDHTSNMKNPVAGSETTYQMQRSRQLSQSSPRSGEGGLLDPFSSEGAAQVPQRLGFSKQQLHVLKAQILAFRRLKKGDGTLPQELLQAIAPPPLEMQHHQGIPPSLATNHDRSGGRTTEDRSSPLEANENNLQVIASSSAPKNLKEEPLSVEEKPTDVTMFIQGKASVTKDQTPIASNRKDEQQTTAASLNPEQEGERSSQRTSSRLDIPVDKGKAVVPQVPDNTQTKNSVQSSNISLPKDVSAAKKYHGPLFDFPFFTRKHDSFGGLMMMNNDSNLTLAYDVKDILLEEGSDFPGKRRAESLKKIGGLLAVNLERKRIRPDLVLRLQIEEKKLKLVDRQARLRDEVDQQQQEIMAMPDRPYRKFVRLCERQRMELIRQVQASQKVMREKQLKSIFQWRKKLLEAHWTIRDARTARNRGVAKYHERMLREFSKRKDDDRNKRMEALKNNDVERYREMLLEQQTSISGAAAERYAVLSSFLTQTEEYLNKLGNKITATKNHQDVEEAANAAALTARSQGLSEEEVRAAAACTREEMVIRNRFSEMNAPKDGSSVNKYYSLAHAVNERVTRQPSMLRAGTLRDYQLVGLQWMLSLYNNKLNGILADEMGLGKTVQVMALIAYLMEFKGNNGPHLIIVPNAVLVNWKSELHTWLPSVSCIYYVGTKDQRSRLFSQEVCAMKFNVLVTTYEFIMYDRSKLSKVDWRYIIIDEAQRMKDRESVLARDLDRYRCQRRLLLTGTPLQNDLKELWSLLNLLLPEVFDNKKAFHDWFSQPFQKEVPTHNVEDDWLETEKKVIIIHRLHQILEPFMLRRRVEDVEGSLPAKVSIVLKCRMSAIQSSVYDWVKSTGTLRVDPEEEKLRVERNPKYQVKTYKTLNNRCMELRKTCNHPLLNYPYFNDFSKDFLVQSCGKLWILDRILVKLQRTGHRVLLFSTMTKLLDILEEYLQWRQLVFRRIDGTTSLEDRESAIVDFNSPDTDCFIFLLSIRAAGRGLNLQSADTVVIYDPDPNPKNEEQAVARAHRIGQKREVKVIYMEAVVDKISSHQKEDEFRSGGIVDSEDDLAGKDRYMGSIESLIRNNIQQYKIDMADEVINAGRFDQRTTHEERRSTLETLLHDEERYQETLHDVPSLQEVNRMIARSESEVEIFDQMDEEFDWTGEMTRYDQVPKWVRATTKEVNATVAALSKKPSKNTFLNGIASDLPEKRRGRPKGKKVPIYKELDDDNGEFSEASSEEGHNRYSPQEEEGGVGEFEEDEEFNGGNVERLHINKDQSDEDVPICNRSYEYTNRTRENARRNPVRVKAACSGSSPESGKQMQVASPTISSQKFGSLSALDARPSSLSKKLSDDLEEGEIAVSGDSPLDPQQSGSWIQDRDEGEDEQQVLQPKIKRKRSIRLRPRPMVKRVDEKYPNEKLSFSRSDSSQLPFQLDNKYKAKLKAAAVSEPKTPIESSVVPKHDQYDSSVKGRRNAPAGKLSNTSKSHTPIKVGRSTTLSTTSGSSEGKFTKNSGSGIGSSKMPDIIQRRCKNVMSKLQRRIDKEGPQIVPLLTDLWNRIENSGYVSSVGNSLLDLRKIDQRVEKFEYNNVMELVIDVQFMLKSAMQYFGFSHEVRSEARKVHELFFDILKIAFPEDDFQEARNSVSFSGPMMSPSTLRQQTVISSQGKRQRAVNNNDVESDHPDLHSGPTPIQKQLTRSQLLQKEYSRLGSSSSSSSSRREHVQLQDETRAAAAAALAHPGELVICKKKRKDREKSSIQKLGRASPGSTPISQRETRSSGQHSIQQQASDSGVGWANPVKRLRTDSGRRRASHL
ncbi:ATP-dependent helicase BRM-like [Impatiens glandulifera]|uniref:ATP-dependent helicase BRM-like n=1 Tax=Impatiens glandulifera TaxID=253017 RepID=UPI001FB0EF22|nr:ATP-dependent helicase BRM-like [Impatiens glandulifera]